MKKDEIHPGDIQRILFGDTPPEFLVEVVIRTFVIYAALLLCVRLMGKRMVGQLTISEMAVMLTLGAIVSPAMQAPTTGILLGMLILLCALFFQRGINYLEFRSPRLESVNHGRITTLVEDGVLALKELKRAGITQQQLFAILRGKGFHHLGKIDRVYLEASGLYSIYSSEASRPGLSVLPPEDESLTSGEGESHPHVCTLCGFVQINADPDQVCPNCMATDWKPALMK